MFSLFNLKVQQISVSDVKNAIDENQKYILLDVRTSSEYSKGKIKGSINIPLDDVENKITEIIPDKNAQIYVYCLSGARSEQAAQIMIKLGYANVKNISSGLLAWRAKGYSLIE